ncbi:transposase [Rhodobacteraceae bacterium R_SAG2]|nr:transposase [Rhodobacteraceae bacterium R_SAG2]
MCNASGYGRDDHPVRVIDAFVDELDFAAADFNRCAPAQTGRPGYHPSVLLKIFIYRYMNRVASSRRLEKEAGRNVEVMWLTGRLVPDHKTIADFRKENGPAIRKSAPGLSNSAARSAWWQPGQRPLMAAR